MDSSDEERGGLGAARGKKKGRRRMLGGDSDDDDDIMGFGRRGGLGSGGRRGGGGNDDNIFGVFADGDDSDGSGSGARKGKGRGRGRGKGRGRGRGEVGAGGAVAFVAGKKIEPSKVPTKSVSAEAGSDDEVDSRFKFDGAPNAPPAAEQGPQLPSRNQMSFNQMSENYGKGFEMLKKMGFKGGGLGKREDGIANPIQVQKRKAGEAIQDDGEMVNQDLYGRNHYEDKKSVEELLNQGAAKSDKTPKASESWKKDERAKRPKTVYRTAAEVAAEAAAKAEGTGGGLGMRIVDMRGPEVRIATSFSDLAAHMNGDTVKSLKELRHNTRLLVARYEDKIRSLAEKKKFYENVLLSVERDREHLEATASLGQKEVAHCKSMVETIEGLREKQDAGEISLEALGSAFEKMRKERPTEFKAIKGFDVAIALAVPVARKEFANWRPLESPEAGLKPLAPWRRLVEGESSSSAVYQLCDGALLPRLRTALVNWSARDCDSCIRLVERCKAMLPPAAVEAVVSEVVMPKLKAEVDAWDPRAEKPMPMHVWLHPWLPVLGKALHALWTPVRFQLSSWLDRWHPSDHSALEVLKAWGKVFSPADWEPLIEKVLGRLERKVFELQVKPSGQDVKPVEDLAIWVGTAPLASLAQVLDTALFPQWHSTLRSWLRQEGCDYGEVVQWYQGWRALLPETLREQKTVQRHLAHGLQVMKHHMSQEEDGESEEEPAPPSPEAVPPPLKKAHAASTAAAAARAAAADAKAAATTAVSAAPAGEEVSLSLSDYMAEVASEHGLVFRPKGRSDNCGRQVYVMGAASISFDKTTCYAAPKGGGPDAAFFPVGFDEVLALAKGELLRKKR
eukprot:TRINITY_DN18733_c0_g1_i1.p1 TRINITY_DN18733_c0_g1~~TRINITY_DN18733_c0_g1_i1.p1  ORF type:complete len:848 (-),score=284.53 TRINITY_DN18733_c0_g1_i1:51-2594(-)